MGKKPHSASSSSLHPALGHKELAKEFYHHMLLIRRFEEKAGQLYGMGHIAGFCHLYIGQEAVAVGMQSVTQKNDTIITAYRDHGHMLACGMSAPAVMAELTGRMGGCSKGKGGSMHMFSREKNFYGGHGIVGAQVSLGTGLAFAHAYQKDGGICMTYMGDGAANQGQVYESFNMASLWKLPVVYIIENNGYSMGTAVSRHSSSSQFFTRGEAYGIPGMEVDGMDVFKVREAGALAADHARSGKGPFILEMNTYRYRGHSMSDPAKYRSKEEVEDIKNKRDPLFLLRHYMETHKLAGEEDFKAMEKEIKEIVAQSAEFALSSPEPSADELYTDVVL